MPYTVTPTDLHRLRPERVHSALPDPLYVCGRLDGLAAPSVAIVGTRAPSERGRHLARRLARELAEAGVCIVSGLALGIDTAAHEGALAAGAPTIGVLAGGHHRFFPRSNLRLAKAMLAGGAVVSPLPPHEPPYAARFLARNGLIVALADAVVILEAPQRSGALNTASWAADAGIPLLVTPGDVDRPKVAGSLALLRDGATLVRDTDDILEALGLLRHRRSAPTLTLPDPSLGDGPCAAAIVEALRTEPATAEELAATLRQPLPQVLAALTMLELSQYLCRDDDGRIALTPALAREQRSNAESTASYAPTSSVHRSLEERADPESRR